MTLAPTCSGTSIDVLPTQFTSLQPETNALPATNAQARLLPEELWPACLKRALQFHFLSSVLSPAKFFLYLFTEDWILDSRCAQRAVSIHMKALCLTHTI